MLGRCDPEDDHGDVADTIDDYLWLKLSQLTYDTEEMAGQDSRLSLPQLQRRLLEEFGEYMSHPILEHGGALH